MWETLIYGILISAILLQNIIARLERKDLYDRLMSHNFKEYKDLSEKNVQKVQNKSAHFKAIEKWKNQE